jgi:predicted outer membrane protein
MRWTPALTVGSIALSAGMALAQQSNTETERRQPAAAERQQGEREGARREGRRDANPKDAMFAKCLAIDNSAEIQIAEFAAQRLQNDQAKQFAQQMVLDHRAMLEKLGQFGAKEIDLSATNAKSDQSADVTVRTGAGQADVNVKVDERDGEQRRAERRETRTERRDGDEADFVAIKQEIAQECVRTAQEELAAKPANEVDRCYMAAQVFSHQHMLVGLKVLERHASPAMKETLAQAAQTTEQHLNHAKEILKSLDGQHHAETPATSGTTSR